MLSGDDLPLERWKGVEIPPGNYVFKECGIRLDYTSSAENPLSPDDLFDKAEEGVEKIVAKSGGRVLAGRREEEGTICVFWFLVVFPLATVTIVEVADEPPGGALGYTINPN